MACRKKGLLGLDPVLSPFEGNISLISTMRIKLYIQATKEIYKETDKLDFPVSNSKDIIYHFLGLVNKYGWGCLVFMVLNATGAKNIFRVVEQIQLVEI